MALFMQTPAMTTLIDSVKAIGVGDKPTSGSAKKKYKLVRFFLCIIEFITAVGLYDEKSPEVEEQLKEFFKRCDAFFGDGTEEGKGNGRGQLHDQLSEHYFHNPDSLDEEADILHLVFDLVQPAYVHGRANNYYVLEMREALGASVMGGAKFLSTYVSRCKTAFIKEEEDAAVIKKDIKKEEEEEDDDDVVVVEDPEVEKSEKREKVPDQARDKKDRQKRPRDSEDDKEDGKEDGREHGKKQKRFFAREVVQHTISYLTSNSNIKYLDAMEIFLAAKNPSNLSMETWSVEKKMMYWFLTEANSSITKEEQKWVLDKSADIIDLMTNLCPIGVLPCCCLRTCWLSSGRQYYDVRLGCCRLAVLGLVGCARAGR
eukprot:2173188-Rhodomonas_salina.1